MSYPWYLGSTSSYLVLLPVKDILCFRPDCTLGRCGTLQRTQKSANWPSPSLPIHHAHPPRCSPHQKPCPGSLFSLLHGEKGRLGLSLQSRLQTNTDSQIRVCTIDSLQSSNGYSDGNRRSRCFAFEVGIVTSHSRRHRSTLTDCTPRAETRSCA